MIFIAKCFCKYSICTKSSECRRYIEPGDTEINFKAICREDNDYWMFQQADIDIVVKEEAKEET